MDLGAFKTFLQDTGIKKTTEQKVEIFRESCVQNNRQRLSCDDFIECIRKHQLIPNFQTLEKNKAQREKEMAIQEESEDSDSEVPSSQKQSIVESFMSSPQKKNSKVEPKNAKLEVKKADLKNQKSSVIKQEQEPKQFESIAEAKSECSSSQ